MKILKLFAFSFTRQKRDRKYARAGGSNKVALCFLSLLLSTVMVSLAQTPTPTVPPDDEPDPMPSSQERLLDAYQPSAYSSDPTVLQRLRFLLTPRCGATGPIQSP